MVISASPAMNELAGLGQNRDDPSASLGEDFIEDLHRLDQADDRAGLDTSLRPRRTAAYRAQSVR